MAVALTLVRLTLTLLRRSMTGSRGAWMAPGAMAGTGPAVSTIVLAALYRASPGHPRGPARRGVCVVAGRLERGTGVGRWSAC
jgi:hypothetical protein